MPLLDVRGVSKTFGSRSVLCGPFRRQPRVHAILDVSLRIQQGSTVAIVGESGSGKSTLARLIGGLLQPDAGSIALGERLLDRNAWRRPDIRAAVQMVFQNPYASLNPRWRVGRIVGEAVQLAQRTATRREVESQVAQLFEQVGLPSAATARFPHEFSGGQRQRISLARALATRPRLLICDEPTSALDVSVQAQVLNLMRDLQVRHGLTYLLITHNLAVVSHMADEVAVMRHGSIVEQGERMQVLEQARASYTRSLLDAAASVEPLACSSAGLGANLSQQVDRAGVVEG